MADDLPPLQCRNVKKIGGLNLPGNPLGHLGLSWETFTFYFTLLYFTLFYFTLLYFALLYFTLLYFLNHVP